MADSNEVLDTLSKLEIDMKSRLLANPNKFLPTQTYCIGKWFGQLREEIKEDDTLEILNKLEDKWYNWMNNLPASHIHWIKVNQEVTELLEQLKKRIK